MKSLYHISGISVKAVLVIAVFFFLGFKGLAQAPTSPSTNFSVDNIDGDRFIVRFTPGNGDKRIIVASTSPVTAIPQDNTDYIADPVFGLGNEIEPGEFIVYEGTSSALWIYGFNHSTTYYFKVFEFNGSDFNTEYLTSQYLEGSGTTLSGPTTQASNLTFSNIKGTSMTVSWTKGDGHGRILVGKAGSAVDFDPTDLETIRASAGGFTTTYYDLGNGNYGLYSSSGNSVNIYGLQPGETYHFEVFEYKGSSGKIYLQNGATGSQITATAPTIAASGAHFTNVDGNRFIHRFIKGDGINRMVIAREGSPVTSVPTDGLTYTTNETFGLGQELKEGEFVVSNGSSTDHWVYGLKPSTTYHFAVFEYNGSGTGTYYLTDTYLASSHATLSGPTIQASNLTFSNIKGTSMTVSWTKGDGHGRILVGKAGSAVDFDPTDLETIRASAGGFTTTYYDLGNGNYGLYSSSGNSVNIYGLQPGETYHFEVFEYKGSSGKIYLQNGATGSQITATAPTIAASGAHFTNVDGNRFIHRFIKGDGINRMVIAREGSPVTSVPTDGLTYTTNETFGLGQELNEGEFVVSNGSSTDHWVYGLKPSTTYHFAVFEYNGSGTGTYYLTDTYLASSHATLSGPTIQASNLTFSNIKGTSMTVSWTKGDGHGRILVGKAGSAVDFDPTDLETIRASAGGFTTTYYDLGNGNYGLYSSSGNSVNIYGLQPGETYHFEVFEYKGSSGKIYLQNGATGSQITATAPTIAASGAHFTNVDGNRFIHRFIKGDGINRMVIAREGSPVTSVPTDGLTYTTNETFGLGQELNEGEFVVSNGSSTDHWVYGLKPSTTYHFAIFEYNGSDTGTYYLTDTYLASSQATLSNPTVQSNNAFISSRSTTSINISWTRGDGSSRMLIARKDGPVNVEPADLTNYSNYYGGFGNPFYEIGTSGNYVLYMGTGNNVNISNLEAGTNYNFALFEYNGSTAKLYKRPGYLFALETFGERPTTQVSSAQFSNVDFSSFDVNFTAGNGSRRLVLAREAGPVNTAPADFTAYTASGTFGVGDQIGTGNFVVYNDIGQNFHLEGLDPGKTYHFAFYEYAVSDQGELYMVPAYETNQTTKGAPTQLATDLSVSPPCSTTVDISWISGSGEGRMVVVSPEELTGIPENFTDYAASSIYGTGAALGNGFAVYKGSGTLAAVSGLAENMDYFINIFEFNGIGADSYFNKTPLQGTIGDFQPPLVEPIAEQEVASTTGCQALVPDFTSLALVTDNCDEAPVVTQEPLEGAILTGSTLITISVTDASGNESTTTFNAVVIDETAPLIQEIPAQTVSINESCDAVVPDYTSLAAVTDNCDETPIIVQEPAPGTVLNGTTPITITATDISGNSNSIAFDASLEAVAVSELLCVENQTVEINLEQCTYTHAGKGWDAQLSSSCPSASIASTFDSDGVSWTKNSPSDASANITWHETGGNPGGFIRFNEPGQGTVDYFNAPPSFLGDKTGYYGGKITIDMKSNRSTNSGSMVQISGNGVSLLSLPTAPLTTWSTFQIAFTPGEWTSQNTGSVATEEEIRSVLGNIEKLIIRTDWFVGSEATDMDNVKLFPGPPAYELAGATQANGSSLDGVVFNIGETTVTWHSANSNETSGTCSFTVTVEDNIFPTITAPSNVTAEECSNTVDLGTPISEDNCSEVTVEAYIGEVLIDPATHVFETGTTTVTWKATDASGNETSADQLIEVSGASSITLNTSPGNLALVTPTQGSSTTEFTFSVMYTDDSGTLPAPGFPVLELDANGDGDALDPLDMILLMQETDPADLVVTDGKNYTVKVNDLAVLNWNSRIVAENSIGCSASTTFDNIPFVSDDLLDISIFANDISFSKDNPAIGEPIKIYATIHNASAFAAENFEVSLYAEDQHLFTEIVTLIPPGSSLTLEWDYGFDISEFYPMKVVIDETNVLQEDNELDNFAIRPVIVGDFVLPGGIEVNASLTETVLYPKSNLHITGNAVYWGIEEDIDPDVAGATLKATIDGGRSGQVYSRSDGTFDLFLRVPDEPGIYTVSGEMTDYTLSAGFGPLTFEVLATPPSPDLVSSISLDSNSILQGGAISGTATVTNTGNLAAENFTFVYYNCEAVIGEESIATLAPGQSLQFPFTVNVSSVGDCLHQNNCSFYSVADSDNTVVERTENNNVGSRALTVLPSRPDLTPSQAHIPSRVNMLNEVGFNLRIDNIGGVPAGSAFTANIYIDDVLVYSESISELNSCEPRNVSFSHTFENINDHVMSIKVDEAGTIDEYRENNNSLSRTIRHLPPPPEMPNLNIKISDLTSIPVLPAEGAVFELHANFRNNGNADLTAPFDVEFKITEGGVERMQTINITEDLLVGQSLSKSIETSIAAYGDHKFKVELDKSDVITEKAEVDNSAEIPLCVDLEPLRTGRVWNGNFYRDTQQHLTAFIQNKGIFTATDVTVKFLLDEQVIASTIVATVPPTYYGSGHSISIPYIFEESGEFLLTVKVDDPNIYIECDEENNSTGNLILIKDPQPDLRVLSQFISPTELNPDLEESIDIFLSFENIGVMRSDAFMARLAVDDVQLGQEILVPALDPGEDGTVAIAAPYSSSTGGVKIIRGFVDPNNLIIESNETNNEASRAIIVGDAPNLFFNSLNFDPGCPVNGDVVNISAQLTNEGDLGTEAEVQFYYIAASDTIPIERKTIMMEPNSSGSIDINWTVVNNTYSIYASIENTVLPEYDVLDNNISGEFCANEQFMVSTATQGQGIIKKNPGEARYEPGTVVEMTAIPAQGWYFKNWTGDLTGNTNPASLLIDSDKTATAVFEEIPAMEFTINLDIQGEGNITRTPDQVTYSTGQMVALSAIPAEGWVFIEYRGDLQSSSPEENVLMDATKSITGVFVEELAVAYNVIPASCTSFPDGEIDITVSGGSIPYSYEWDNDGIGAEDPEADVQDLENITAGSYNVIITDANGLTESLAITVGSESQGVVYYADADEDGLGNPTVSQEACEQPAQFVTNADDCDDTNNQIGVATIWYADTDEDTFGDPGATLAACTKPDGYVENSSDCDDADKLTGEAPEWYLDSDGDGHGGSDVIQRTCQPPDGYVASSDDCDDQDQTKYPGATEVPDDNIDQDCDGQDLIGLKITAPTDITATSCGEIDLGVPITAGNSAEAQISNNAPSNFSMGTTTVVWTITDDGKTATDEQLVIINNAAPVVHSIVAPVDPQPIHQEVILTATFTSPDIAYVNWNWGDGTITSGEVGDLITGRHAYSLPGIYTVSCTIENSCGVTASMEYEFIVAYDSSGGFATGRGWFYSLPGAYLEDVTAEGEASFGFVSKYKKGAVVPDGRTQFEFRSAQFNFESTSYSWLIVAGTRAMFKGEGEVNGIGGYGFLLSAIDEDTGDRFRIKIWELGTEIIIYDNQFGDEDTADANTYLTKGSIRIHTGKGNPSKGHEETDKRLQYDHISAYPNPMQSNGFWLSFPAAMEGEIFQAGIYDLNGRILAEKELKIGNGGGDQFWDVDHTKWGQGVYLLILQSETNKYEIRLMKE